MGKNDYIKIRGITPNKKSKIKIMGKHLPENSTLNIQKVKDNVCRCINKNIAPSVKNRLVNWSEVYNISISSDLTYNWQPDEEIFITIDDINVSNSEMVKVTHILDNELSIKNGIKNGTLISYSETGLSDLFPEECESTRRVTGEENTIYYTIIQNEKIIRNTNGSITFPSDSLSIYVVDKFINTSSYKNVDNGETQYVEIGENIKLQWGISDNISTSDKFVDRDSAIRGNWSVTSGTDTIRIVTYNIEQLDENKCTCSMPNGTHEFGCPAYDTPPNYHYWYVDVYGIKAGNAMLTFSYIDYINSTTNQHSVNIPIVVNEYGNNVFKIEDTINQNGCISVVATGNYSNYSNFIWSRSDGVSIRKKAILNDGRSVNVAVDKGGIDSEDLIAKTYTVTASYNDNTASADCTIYYGNGILNGSFETPIVKTTTIDANGNEVYASHYHQFSNGHPNLYWKTTGTGEGKDFGKDVEITAVVPYIDDNGVMQSRAQNSYLFLNINSVDDVCIDGDQFAEINSSRYGSLYQDIITTPSAILNWNVRHRARGIRVNHVIQKTIDEMCVIIMSADDAKYIINVDDTKQLLKNIATEKYNETDNTKFICWELNSNIYTQQNEENWKNTLHTSIVNGHEVKFYIYACRSDNTEWKLHSGTFIIPDNQYLTRFLFIATVSGIGSLAGGNLIDSVNTICNDIPWRIEYYLDNVLQHDLTESGYAQLSIDDIAELNKKAEHRGDIRFNNKIFVGSTINDKDFNYKTELTTVYSNHNILRLYYESDFDISSGNINKELHYHSSLNLIDHDNDIVYNDHIPHSENIEPKNGNKLYLEDCDVSSLTWEDLFPEYKFIYWERNCENDTDETMNLYAIWENK